MSCKKYVYYEAQESRHGRATYCVCNRVDGVNDSRFPNSVCEVIFQDNERELEKKRHFLSNKKSVCLVGIVMDCLTNLKMIKVWKKVRHEHYLK